MKRLSLLMVLGFAALSVFTTGCRRAPAAPKQYYDSELAQMQKKVPVVEERFMSDRYPWQGRERGTSDQLPVRILSSQARIDAEIKRLNKVVRGEPKPCCRDRCCWWHKEK